MASDYHAVLTSHHARVFFGFEASPVLGFEPLRKCVDWSEFIFQRICSWNDLGELLSIGLTALEVFLQANVTGPPLSWNSTTMIFPPVLFDENRNIERLRKVLILTLSLDGEAVYQLIPNIELFVLAKFILNHQRLEEGLNGRLARIRVNVWHQRLLSEVSPTLQTQIYGMLDLLQESILDKASTTEDISPAHFLIERATIHTLHGLDRKAREDLTRAAKERSFHFALTGRLGKRTKFQEKELSQLVVLAKSAETQHSISSLQGSDKPRPKALDLDDDTLLESISFSTKDDSFPVFQADADLPSELQSLDPGNQPLLDPLDAIILLATATSVTNMSPSDGLTREETLPYAERVLSGGSSNWQVYTQALLVRSRIEGYRSRTIERGVLQLQALVDQVIAETTALDLPNGEQAAQGLTSNGPTTFLPQPKQSESAPVSERLQYIYQLASPPRWKLESELADRWVSLGGLRTALEIYERLQMWAEFALCWAANDREDKARKIIRRQLYDSIVVTPLVKPLEDDQDSDVDNYMVEKDPLPADAPRLFSILGDIEKSVAAYERAWEISNHRYARAQRSLGKHYSAAGDMARADDAYAKSLKVSPQNHSTWFALGCVRLQTEDFAGAVEAFGRAVQIEDTDAESWSNLAVSLLKVPSNISTDTGTDPTNDEFAFDHEQETPKKPATDLQKHVREAFVALKRAAALKRDSFRIWQNLLSVSVKLSPPPYTDIIIAQTRLIDLLGKLKGETCVDVEILEALVAHLVATAPSRWDQEEDVHIDEHQAEDGPSRRTGFEKMVVDLVQKKVVPLITSSRRLWLLTAKLSLHLQHPSAALSAYEKAWRATLNQPGWEIGGGTQAAKGAWREVVDSTVDLIDAYESLGERSRESGMGAGEPVAKDWKFKSRSAVRSVLARAEDGWEEDRGYIALNERLQELKSA